MATELLIDRVQQYPTLYDVEHEDYKNVRKKERIWEAIADELGEPTDTLKKKWKNLRDSFTKHVAANKCTSTSGEKKPYESWKWSAKMEWFKPFVGNTRTHNTEAGDVQPPLQILIDEITSLGNIDRQSCEDYGHYDSDVDQRLRVDNSVSGSSEKSGRRKRKLASDQEAASETDRVIQYFYTKEREMDDTDYMMIGIAKSIKKLSRKRQILARKRITDVVAELELEDLKDSDSASALTSPSTSHSQLRS